MKVLHIINNLGSGGAEKLLEDLIPLMNKTENVEADILLLTDKKNVFYDALIKNGVKVDVVKYRNMYDVRNIFEIKKYIVDGSYDIVHSHIFPTQYWVAISRLFLKNKKIKFITTEHNTHNRRREYFYFRQVDKFVYSQYDMIVSIGEQTKSELINWIDNEFKEKEKHAVIENGVNLEKIKLALPYKKTELINCITENEILICMVGRFSEQKDQPSLIRAVSKLSQGIHLLLVGEGPLMEHNEELVEELGISDRVHFLGFRQDIPRILKTVDIVVLSSHWEGFGLVAVEGMAAGKPLIATDVGGLAEVVRGAGVLFEKGNWSQLSNLIKEMIINDDKFKRVKRDCLERSRLYDINITLKKYLELYSRIL